ncbi:MAG: hypothetical protein WBD20_24980 [Pirellulaceae bacterium]
MVNYQGPRLIRRLINALDVDIFDRITEIESERYDLSNVRLTVDDIKAMDSLQRIAITRKSVRNVQQDDVKLVEAKVPLCRQGELRTVGSRIEMDVAPMPLFLGCAD